ncbi:hypothetical protein RFI_35328 [Reticulomyxa filosa]|uniref:MMS19 nucleotide excision repair protein n=1 Tax=Reticulomyxa filosa TaxID=46433 RepID=X6LLT8_RETFI|nr:hypothetical protein RFI_35328 [Reticulomyxa filosa]|eukprot:ETO02112.1 hypothetical protein RFI_35328 [Reticulomyxa filosa]
MEIYSLRHLSDSWMAKKIPETLCYVSYCLNTFVVYLIRSKFKTTLKLNIFFFFFKKKKKLMVYPLIVELFDVISVYYPIDFTPPANDTHGITSDHLRDALCECFKSHSLLSSYALPLILEKLQEPENDKQHFDMLTCLRECLECYGLTIIQSYLRQLYELMKSQILFGNFSDTNTYVLDECLHVMKVIMQMICRQKGLFFFFFLRYIYMLCVVKYTRGLCLCLCLCVYKADGETSTQSTNGRDENEKLWIENVNCIGWTSFVEPLLMDGENELKIPDAKMARLFGKIIATCAACHHIAFLCLMKRFWTLIFTKYHQKDISSDSPKEAIVELLTNMWTLLHDLFIEDSSIQQQQLLQMQSYLNPMFDFFISIIDNDSTVECVTIQSFFLLLLLIESNM